MFKLRVAAALSVVAGVAAGVVVWAQTPMREGRWEVIAQMQMPGLPSAMPEMKSVQCVTPEQLKDPAKSLPSGPGSGNCKMTDYKVDGGKVTWKTACEGVAGSGELVFQGDTYAGTITMAAPQGTMTMKLRGQRVGDCTP
jgi:hypothetical protein